MTSFYRNLLSICFGVSILLLLFTNCSLEGFRGHTFGSEGGGFTDPAANIKVNLLRTEGSVNRVQSRMSQTGSYYSFAENSKGAIIYEFTLKESTNIHLIGEFTSPKSPNNFVTFSIDSRPTRHWYLTESRWFQLNIYDHGIHLEQGTHQIKIEITDPGIKMGQFWLSSNPDARPFFTPKMGTSEERPLSIGRELKVRSSNELLKQIQRARPGDHIVIKNGTYSDWEIELKAYGKIDRPIVIRAETPGKVIFKGSSYFKLLGEHLMLYGLYFKEGNLRKNGEAVVSLGTSSQDCNYCSLINSAIVNVKSQDKKKWVSLSGVHIEVAHSTFKEKSDRGALLIVSRKTARKDRAHIHHNLFLDRPHGEGNGYETIRIGTGKKAQSASFSTVEFNLFENCDGEIEIISNKSTYNTYRFNTFRNNNGSLTLRNGDHAVVEGNYFVGNGKKGSAGVRLIDHSHFVVSNHFESLNGDLTARMPLTLVNGTKVDIETVYRPVFSSTVAFNTLINNRSNIGVGAAYPDHHFEPENNFIAFNIINTETEGFIGTSFNRNEFLDNFGEEVEASEGTILRPMGITTETWHNIQRPIGLSKNIINVDQDKLRNFIFSRGQFDRLVIKNGTLYDYFIPLNKQTTGCIFKL